jgi:N-methylhydantoinase B
MNAVQIEIFRHLLQSAAEEMGITLRRTAFSANIKERLDFSCAITDAAGEMAAQASHIPVHLGSSHLTAQLVQKTVRLSPGDVVILNDPFRGGTHLPDITLFAPFFAGDDKKPFMGVLVRAHHSDVGGGVPGSMGSFDEIYKEGLVIPPVKIVKAGVLDEEIVEFITANVRTPVERRADLSAQIACAQKGVARIGELVDRYGRDVLADATQSLKERAARAVRAVIAGLPRGRHRFSDRLDGPGTPKIVVTVSAERGRLTVDFTGSDPMMKASLNANVAVTLSSVFYALRALTDESIPTNSGCLWPVRAIIPRKTIVGAERPAAVAGGNVETSQCIVDVLFGAFAEVLPKRMPAASQGTMNSSSFGGQRQDGTAFTYYETIAGGHGATFLRDGASGMHSHMTNTLNTPIEAFEREFPVRITAYHLRRKSGGDGAHRGGDGVVREIEALVPITATVLSTRRDSAPYGLFGGQPGMRGRNIHVTRDGEIDVPGTATRSLLPGERLRVETPGGGGYGSPKKKSGEECGRMPSAASSALSDRSTKNGSRAPTPSAAHTPKNRIKNGKGKS